MINGIGKSYINSTYYPGRGVGINIKIPTVPQMRTKGQCKINENELVKKIVKLAQSDAAAGKDSQHGDKINGIREGTAEWKKLRDDYISFSSPDRMSIINNTLSNFAGQMKSLNLTSKNKELSIFDVLFNNSRKFGSDVEINLVKFKDEFGNEIAQYSPNGWHQIPTPAESARTTAFYELWNQALADAQAELGL